MAPPPDHQHWSLDKRVPIALIITLVVQIALFGVFMGTLSSRVSSLEHQVEGMTPRGDRLTTLEVEFRSMQRVLKTELSGVRRSIDRLETRIERRTETRRSGRRNFTTETDGSGD